MESFSGTGEVRVYAGGKVIMRKSESIGFVIFNRPEKHNAMSLEMWTGLGDILEELRTDRLIRTVIMTGAGDKAFVSGADISEFDNKRGSAEAFREYERITANSREKLASFPKPLIASIRGYCLGGGLSIAMLADIRIGSVCSKFGIPAARLGLAYSHAGVQSLLDLVGAAHARMMLYTGEHIDAGEAERIGLINKCVPTETLQGTVLNIARRIADNAPLSVVASKITIDQLLKDSVDRNPEKIRLAHAACVDSQDYVEGRNAFIEKRQAKFQGK
jgi:enoyl-CoA hydratase